MLRIMFIPFLVLFVTICLAAFLVLISKRKPRSRDAELNRNHSYRKEPHADQVAEHPSRLKDNDITRE